MLKQLDSTYWRNLENIHNSRAHRPTVLDRQVAEAILRAGILAIEDRQNLKTCHRVVPAPTGSGKSTCSIALATALIEAGTGTSVLFVCETIKQADAVYQQLKEFSAYGDVAIWTSEHDQARPEQGDKHNARFYLNDLAIHRIVVVTHKLYKRHASGFALRYNNSERTLTIIDERIQEVAVFDLDLGDIAKARDSVMSEYGCESDAFRAVDELYRFADRRWAANDNGNRPYCPLIKSLSPWFDSAEASQLFHASEGGHLSKVIGLARCLAKGNAFVANWVGGKEGRRFMGYHHDLPILPGTILLDATAGIDGVNDVAGWRATVSTPTLSYANLDICVLAPPISLIGPQERISQIVRSPKGASDYAAYIRETVLAHTTPGELVLVVTHKALLDSAFLPGNASFDDGQAYDLDGRKVCFINWGAGIGSNQWRNASAVFLFGAFHLPKRTMVAINLALQGKPSSSDLLERIQSPNSPEATLKQLENGHLARWIVQLAMRGSARNISADGECGKQRLFVTTDFRWFMEHHGRLFPGARITQDESVRLRLQAERGGATGLAAVLFSSPDSTLTTARIKELTGIDFSKHGGRYLSDPFVKQAMAEGGWTFIKGGGRGKPSRFERSVWPHADNDNNEYELAFTA
ncbi:DEAD/DEAH box helicase family protein [Microcystis sp. Msp_OC_L_20101000_S702]|uniref:DEAD/DEAH box helicase family protein n=1 Tax=Microcystis sp. Msp_OC_L_20101000_S702 TaxID=2486218 RepID=UPI00257F4B58|nr:DEAD/DEAH box helicase family protein [Microcystis sp. Msp_OC_L_20101000_S702]